ncbi:hypothetical protein NL676_000786 [Syzygium grande]|nr:hypothetical protein NL676_000786 [Syzygium grande]
MSPSPSEGMMQIKILHRYDVSPPANSVPATALPLTFFDIPPLRGFFPFAANLVLPLAPPRKPHILYSHGDSLSLTVAESATDFAELVTDEARDATLIHPLVPHLAAPRAFNGAHVGPLMAIQVTLFPNKGLCIGVHFLHIAADGRSFSHFMKSWASIHRSAGDPTCVDPDDSGPFHDREVIKEPNGIVPILLKDWWSCAVLE